LRSDRKHSKQSVWSRSAFDDVAIAKPGLSVTTTLAKMTNLFALVRG
jgi:hypothetical protein